ncbi:hypothetical protein Fmac_021305 [Flemingia macrophylla]|uniref:Uncharacterized protein n=1 Tax=Flemingia macrophylla TaxID=520843 RepID=A0ABD1LWG9_9FABA
MALDDRFAEFNPETCVVLGGKGFLERLLFLRLLQLGDKPLNEEMLDEGEDVRSLRNVALMRLRGEGETMVDYDAWLTEESSQRDLRGFQEVFQSHMFFNPVSAFHTLESEMSSYSLLLFVDASDKPLNEEMLDKGVETL